MIISIQGVNTESYKRICGVDINFDHLVEAIRYMGRNRGDCLLHIKTVDTALRPGEDEIFYELFGGCCDTIFINNTIPAYPEVEYSVILDGKDTNRQIGGYHGYEGSRFCCTEIFYMIGIFPNGDVAPCCSCTDAPVIGNIHDKTLKEMWNGSKHKELMKLHLKNMRHTIPGCDVCTNLMYDTHPMDNVDSAASDILKRIE
jgi:radical SAM protein with 4Fe4S-binding SPASM domain